MILETLIPVILNWHTGEIVEVRDFGLGNSPMPMLLELFGNIVEQHRCLSNSSCMEIILYVEERISLVARRADYCGFLCQKWLSLIDLLTCRCIILAEEVK